MILDCHIHLDEGPIEREKFYESAAKIGVGGGIVMSIPPGGYRGGDKGIADAKRRLENLFQWTASDADLFPFLWMDPTEDDAVEQAKLAISMGVKGFKVICYNFYPGDERAMKTYRVIAEAKKPILFHSGILWNGRSSAKFNRPGGFEDLIEIEGIRFALAHISWPWYDECLSVYGKMESAKNYDKREIEMFIDISPGTPPIYRRDAITKLHTIGYDICDNILFGVDSEAREYDYEKGGELIKNDNIIYADLGLDQQTINKIYGENLKRFVQG